MALEPRYSWAQIAYARALVADKRPLDAERVLRFAQNYSRFPTLDYELANVLASVGLYDEAAAQLAKSFSLKDGQIETKLAGRLPAKAASFSELLAPERRAAIFQNKTADSDANAKMLKALLTFTNALNAERRSPAEDELATLAQEFIAGDDPMRTYRQVYVASKFLKKGVALSTVLDLMESATTGVEAALNVPARRSPCRLKSLPICAPARCRKAARHLCRTLHAQRCPGCFAEKWKTSPGWRFSISTNPTRQFYVSGAPSALRRKERRCGARRCGTWARRSKPSGKGDQALLYYIKSYVAGTGYRAPIGDRESLQEGERHARRTG